MNGFFQRGGFLLSEDGTQYAHAGYAHQTGVGKVQWKDRSMRMEYTSRLGVGGLLLVKFASDLSVELIQQAMADEGLIGSLPAV